MIKFVDIGYTGSSFSPEIEFNNIKKETNNKIIKYKFDIDYEPFKTYCINISDMYILKDILLKNNFIYIGTTLLNQSETPHFLYVF